MRFALLHTLAAMGGILPSDFLAEVSKWAKSCSLSRGLPPTGGKTVLFERPGPYTRVYSRLKPPLANRRAPRAELAPSLLISGGTNYFPAPSVASTACISAMLRFAPQYSDTVSALRSSVCGSTTVMLRLPA